MDHYLAEKWQDRKSKKTEQKKKRGDRKGESSDSPEISGTGNRASQAYLQRDGELNEYSLQYLSV